MRYFFIILTIALFTACAADPADPINCSTIQNEDGSATILCTDGTFSTILPGEDGGCTVTDNENGTYTMTCTDGTTTTCP